MAEAKVSKGKVHYRKASKLTERRCANCWMFVPKDFACIAVAGLIDKDDLCDWHEYPKEKKK